MKGAAIVVRINRSKRWMKTGQKKSNARGAAAEQERVRRERRVNEGDEKILASSYRAFLRAHALTAG